MIFVDEFKLSTKHCKTRGWAPKRTKGVIKANKSCFHASFVVALSKKNIYGIMASDITFNSFMFQRFIEEVLVRRNEDPGSSKVPFVIVMDNNSIHNAASARAYFESTKI